MTSDIEILGLAFLIVGIGLLLAMSWSKYEYGDPRTPVKPPRASADSGKSATPPMVYPTGVIANAPSYSRASIPAKDLKGDANQVTFPVATGLWAGHRVVDNETEFRAWLG